MPTALDLYTTLKNTSGASMFFSFIGKHGKTLAANGTVSIAGLPQHQHGWNDRKQAALERALLAGDINILKTPAAIVADTDVDAALANPSVAATVAATGGGATGGLLAAGHFRVEYSFYNEWGETITGGESADFTVAATNIPRVTLPAIPSGATGIKVYLSNVSVGAVTAGAAKKYYDKITTGTTLDLDVAEYNEGADEFADAPAEPTTNTTAGHVNRALSVADDVVDAIDPSWGSLT